MKYAILFLIVCLNVNALEYGTARNVPKPLADIVDEAFQDVGLIQANKGVFPDVVVTIGDSGGSDCTFLYRDKGLAGGVYIEVIFSQKINWRKRPALAGWVSYHVATFLWLANEGS